MRPAEPFFFNLRPAETFLLLMLPLYSFEFETPVLEGNPANLCPHSCIYQKLEIWHFMLESLKLFSNYS